MQTAQPSPRPPRHPTARCWPRAQRPGMSARANQALHSLRCNCPGQESLAKRLLKRKVRLQCAEGTSQGAPSKSQLLLPWGKTPFARNSPTASLSSHLPTHHLRASACHSRVPPIGMKENSIPRKLQRRTASWRFHRGSTARGARTGRSSARTVPASASAPLRPRASTRPPGLPRSPSLRKSRLAAVLSPTQK